MPAREPWWDDVVASDVAAFYRTDADALKDAGGVSAAGEPRSSPVKGKAGSFIWGDRVRVLRKQGDAWKVGGRGKEVWVHKRHLGGQPLLEIYFIDVGQGDGVLIVTPEGAHAMIDGGNIRAQQNGGHNAADFVDWKFHYDYLDRPDRDDADRNKIRLDAMIATHNDVDHFGGLMDLLDQDARARAELDCNGVTVEGIWHAGLSWWSGGLNAQGKPKARTLGPVEGGRYIKLLDDRASCQAATANLAAPDTDTLDGSWGRFIAAAIATRRRSGAPSRIGRLSNLAHRFLPGFEPQDGSVTIRVLGPIETQVNGQPALTRFPDGDSKNTNGNCVVLRLDYGDRRFLMTGDLNWHSQKLIMAAYGADFVPEFRCEVSKGCHHGSNDVSLTFLEGLRPLCTVISSGDSENYDHPRPNIVAASGITGRRLIDYQNDQLIAPLVYMTEIARGVEITREASLREWKDPQPEYAFKKPGGAEANYDTEEEQSHFRVFLGSSQSSAGDWPRFDNATFVSGLRYGLVNVRSDGKRLFFALMEEQGQDWSVTALSEEDIIRAN